jgi:hypothetical protein
MSDTGTLRVKQICAGRLFSYCLVGPREVYSFGVNNCHMVSSIVYLLEKKIAGIMR